MTVISEHARQYYITAVDGTAQYLAADGPGIREELSCLYVIEEITGAGSNAGTTTCAVSATAQLYADGTDTCVIGVTAAGAVYVQRTAGSDTFNVRLSIVWI